MHKFKFQSALCCGQTNPLLPTALSLCLLSRASLIVWCAVPKSYRTNVLCGYVSRLPFPILNQVRLFPLAEPKQTECKWFSTPFTEQAVCVCVCAKAFCSTSLLGLKHQTKRHFCSGHQVFPLKGVCVCLCVCMCVCVCLCECVCVSMCCVSSVSVCPSVLNVSETWFLRKTPVLWKKLAVVTCGKGAWRVNGRGGDELRWHKL